MTEEPPDEQLYAALRAGDARAGARLYRRHFAGVRGFFLNKVADPGRWDDLVQQTFMTAFYEAEYRGVGSFRSFLYGVANNVLRADYRKTRARARHRADVEDVDELPVAALGAGVSTLMADRAEAQRLIAALRRIPIKYQSVFEMYYWQDLSAGDIARIEGKPIGTIRSHLRFAKRELLREMALAGGSFGELLRGFRSVAAWAREVREQLGPREPPK